jgi:hypothetical protein
LFSAPLNGRYILLAIWAKFVQVIVADICLGRWRATFPLAQTWGKRISTRGSFALGTTATLNRRAAMPLRRSIGAVLYILDGRSTRGALRGKRRLLCGQLGQIAEVETKGTLHCRGAVVVSMWARCVYFAVSLTQHHAHAVVDARGDLGYISELGTR